MPSDHAAEVMTFVAANLRRLRARQGMTQEQLAEFSELDLSFVQRIERGRANISLRTLVALADALEVGPPILLRKAKLAPTVRGRPRKRLTRK